MCRETEARLRALEDREEIRDLVMRYLLAIDDRDFRRLGDLFSEGCALRSPAEGVEVHGRESIVDFFRTVLAGYGPTMHVVHRHLVELVADDRATGVATAHAELSIDGTTYCVALRYYDEYARIEGGWRFADRCYALIYAVPFDQLATALGERLRVMWPGEEPAAAVVPETLETWRIFTRASAGSAPSPDESGDHV